MFKRALLLTTLVCLLGTVVPASAKVISVTLANATSGSPGRMVSTDLAGAPDVRVANWNVLTNTNLTLGDNETVVSDDGSPVDGIRVTITTPRSFSNRDNNSSYKNDQIMYNGVIDCYNDTTTLTLTNIPFGQYDIYFYMRDDGTARAGAFTLVGGPTYYLRGSAGNPAADGTGYVLSTDTTMTAGVGTSIDAANYTVFLGLSGDNTFQITAVNAGDSTMRNKWAGFQIVSKSDPGQASKPSPRDKATDVIRDVPLSWTPGQFAATHDVYFGTVFDDVNTAGRANPKGVLVAQGYDANTYDPAGVFAYGQTYYWRIDEVNAPPSEAIFKGWTWAFTAEPMAYVMKNVTATASSFVTNMGPEKTTNNSGINTSDQHNTTDTNMWLSGNAGPQPTWIQYQFDGVYKLHQMWVWNSNQSLESILGFGVKTATIEYSMDGVSWASLQNVPEFAQATGEDNYTHNTTVDFGGAVARYVKITVTSGWGSMGQYGLSEVRFFCIPVQAREPSPANNATAINPNVTFTWRAGREAVSHQVYLGTDPNALTPAATVNTNSYVPANLILGTRYYWRVDEVNAAATPTTWTGVTWNVTTDPFITIDNMESYNDKEGTSVFNAWIDGYNSTTNGALVGLATPVNGTFCSTTIYRSGRQSMPLGYGTNGITNSEATRTFATIQNWTGNGVTTLTLYFYGQATNTTTVPFWVRLADQSGKTAKVTFGSKPGEDAAVLADPAWTTWNMPLSSFTGIDASKIKSMTIGLGSGTGSGTLYIDDIRLNPAAAGPAALTPTLAGWWKLDNDLKDSSGNGNNGTIGGAPTYVATGKIGASMKFNGTADYIDCGAGTSLDITDQVTLAAWIKPTDITATGQHDIVDKGDNAYSLRVSAGQVQFYFYYSAGWHQYNSPTYTSAFNGAWHHVAATYDGVQARIYIDGAIVTSAQYTGGIATATAAVSIGRNTTATGRWYNGELDDIRIYRGALPTSEVKKLANP
jgi:hypothetical protein